MHFRKAIFVFPLLLLFVSFTGHENDWSIQHYNLLGITQSCIGKEAVVFTKLETASVKKMHLHSFSMKEKDFRVFCNGKRVMAGDLLLLSKKDYIDLEIRYTVEQTDSASVLTFATDAPDGKAKRITLNYHQYVVQAWQMMKNTPVEINLTSGCNNSLRVYFDYGGTITSVSMYRDTISPKSPEHKTNYRFGDTMNYITLTKADTGYYEVRFTSCHWGTQFKMHVK